MPRLHSQIDPRSASFAANAAHIDASLAELRVINAEVRQQLERRSA